jgi:isocitrate lyase
VHFEDQLSSAKKCGHLGGKVLVSTAGSHQQAGGRAPGGRRAGRAHGHHRAHRCRCGRPAAVRHDPRDKRFLTGERSSEGFFYVKAGIEQAIDRGLSYAPYCDLIWCETSKPDMAEARRFAAAIHAKFPGKLLAYNCSPSFNWQAKLDAAR